MILPIRLSNNTIVQWLPHDALLITTSGFDTKTCITLDGATVDALLKCIKEHQHLKDAERLCCQVEVSDNIIHEGACMPTTDK